MRFRSLNPVSILSKKKDGESLITVNNGLHRTCCYKIYKTAKKELTKSVFPFESSTIKYKRSFLRSKDSGLLKNF